MKTPKEGRSGALANDAYVSIFKSNFGTFYIHPKAGAVFNELRLASDGMDGRKRSVRKARQDMRTLELAMDTIGQLAFRAGIPAHQIFLPQNGRDEPRGQNTNELTP